MMRMVGRCVMHRFMMWDRCVVHRFMMWHRCTVMHRFMMNLSMMHRLMWFRMMVRMVHLMVLFMHLCVMTC